jgi:beta-glucanase (GH16 family)
MDASPAQSFRAPFLSPSSRPSSSIWSPPSYPNLPSVASSTALPLALPKSKPPLPSTALTQPLQLDDKPWLKRTQPGTISSYFITLLLILLGAIAAVFIVFVGYLSVPLLDDKNLCMVLDEQFSAGSLDQSVWNYDVQLGSSNQDGFQMSTKFSDNVYLSNSNLYIVPTLSSARITDASNFTLPDCNAQDPAQCTPSSTLPPIMSARIHTKSKKNIRFGRIVVRAKLPSGDWLHPRVYMLPEQDTYGPYPASGQIDILEARGNGLAYDARGGNYVEASVEYGPFESVKSQIYGWFGMKRTLWSEGFHDFVLEWDETFMRVYLDKRTQSLLEFPIGRLSFNPFSRRSSSSSGFYFTANSKPSFWSKASFPPTIASFLLPANISGAYPPGTQISLQNPYRGASDAAPFDQKFYLVVELGVGGTTGWFPDGVGGKPWFDAEGDRQAMLNFGAAQGEWLGTWGEMGGKQERALRMRVAFFFRLE